MRIKHLKCPECGAELELSVGYDGMSEEAEQYGKFSPNWGWVVSLDCTKCSRVYPICRTNNRLNISSIADMAGGEIKEKIMNSIKIKMEAIVRELSFISGEINQFIMHIEEKRKDQYDNDISEIEAKEAKELKEIYTFSLLEWRGRLDTVLRILEAGTEYNVLCTYGFKDSIKSINIVKDNEEITITPAICIETDDNGAAYSMVVGLPEENTCVTANNKDTERMR